MHRAGSRLPNELDRCVSVHGAFMLSCAGMVFNRENRRDDLTAIFSPFLRRLEIPTIHNARSRRGFFVVSAKSRLWRRSDARRYRPHALTLEGCCFTAAYAPPKPISDACSLGRGFGAPRRSKRSAHDQRPGGEPQRRRGSCRGRAAPRATDAPQAQGTSAPRPPSWAHRVRATRRPGDERKGAIDRHDGEGQAPRKWAGQHAPTPAGAAAISQTSARKASRGRAGRTHRPRASPSRERMEGAAQRSKPVKRRRAASGRGSSYFPPRAPETARPRQPDGETAAKAGGGDSAGRAT